MFNEYPIDGRLDPPSWSSSSCVPVRTYQPTITVEWTARAPRLLSHCEQQKRVACRDLGTVEGR
jgi:hypothetical protein